MACIGIDILWMNEATFKKDWEQGVERFLLQTSGSTGAPKTIALERAKLIWSAEQTLTFLPSKPKRMYLCLPTHKVGGFMQMVRACVWNIPLCIKTPKAKPVLDMDVKEACISLTPHQLYHCLQSEKTVRALSQAHSILIGGGGIGFEVPDAISRKLFHTYGMTETYSHIAYRRLDSDYFYPLPTVDLDVNEESCLKIKCVLTDGEWLQTSDVVAFKNGGFKILGRNDHVINSGGLKLHPEEMEAEILAENPHAYHSFFIGSIKDAVLGEKAVLVKERGLELSLSPSSNLKYIKITVEVDWLRFTATEKIDRRRSMKEAGLDLA